MNLNKIMDISPLNIPNKSHAEYLEELGSLKKSTKPWHELEFFQPQESISELVYEFQEEHDYALGLQAIFKRRLLAVVKAKITEIGRNEVDR